MNSEYLKPPPEPMCSICQSLLRTRDHWSGIGVHKDCLDAELAKVNLTTINKDALFSMTGEAK